MRNYIRVILFCFLFLHGCQREGVRKETVSPTNVGKHTNTVFSLRTLSPTITPTRGITFTPTPTLTLTIPPIPTFSKEEADQELAKYLETNNGCIDCFWGIIPGRSSDQDVRNMYQKLGERLHQGEGWLDTSLTIKESIRIAISYHYDSQSVNLINTFIGGLLEPSIKKTDWAFYNLDNILQVYGKPSLVGFFIDGNQPPDQRPIYNILMRFEQSNLVIYYSYGKATEVDSQNFTLCPIADQVDSINLWYGKEDSTVPYGPKLLEEVSLMTNEEFYSIFSSPDEHSCIVINKQKIYVSSQ